MGDTNGRRGFFAVLRERKALIVIPAVLFASASVAASSLLPARYRSEATIVVVPPKIPVEWISGMAGVESLEHRVPSIRNEILSRTRLERIIQDLDLYQHERSSGIMEDIISRMRHDVSIVVASGPDATGSGRTSFRIGFTASDPRMAQRVADLLSAFFIDQSTRDRKLILEGSDQFLAGRLADTRQRLTAAEETVRVERARTGKVSEASTIELHVLRDSYRQLLERHETVSIVAGLERREIGEQFKMVDAAQMPARPIGPGRLAVGAMGTVVGLAFGVMLATVSASRHTRWRRDTDDTQAL